MKKNILFWVVCIIAFILWKVVFSTDTAKSVLGAAVASGQELNPAQIKQIEEIAAEIAKQSNANKHLHLDDMTVSFNAVSTGGNVRFENVLRVKNGLSQNEIAQWLAATQQEIIPQACAQNANNLAFERGLSYTYSYSSIYGQKMGDVLVDKATCKIIGNKNFSELDTSEAPSEVDFFLLMANCSPHESSALAR